MFSSAIKTKKLSCPILLLVACSLFSCGVIVRKYPVSKPFVYDTKIEIEGEFSTDARKTLVSQLEGQLHDSIRNRTAQRWVLLRYLDNPAVYDSSNVSKSVIYMRALLNSEGYYRDTIIPEVTIREDRDQQRAFINFKVLPGKLVRLDSISYNLTRDTSGKRLGTPDLQDLAFQSQGQALIKKRDPFSKPLISSERDRLADLYRNNGYLLFTSEELLAIWDTVGIGLLRPTLDPIEQARQLAALRARRQNPTADVEITLRANRDTSHLRKFHVGTITVYPDVDADTAKFVAQNFRAGEYNIITYYNRYKPEIFPANIYLRRGDLYSQRNEQRTLNRFNALNSWRLVNLEQHPRPGEDTVDFILRMSPQKKYAFSTNIEINRNTNQPFLQGNLLGIGLNVSLQNRNFARAANQAITTARYGIELNGNRNNNNNNSLVQSLQAALSHTISFPRYIPYLPINRLFSTTWKENTRTILNLNVSNIDRVEYFNVSTFNSSLGYEFNHGNNLSSLRIPNIEYNLLDRKKGLEIAIDSNASYRYIFNTGLILSTLWSQNFAFSKPAIGQRKYGVSGITRYGAEVSGLFAGLIRNNKFLDSNLYRFVRADFSHRRTYTIRRTALAYRFMVGAGVGLPRFKTPEPDSLNFYLPFYRQFYAGGPNSMRAWGLRKLGPGSRIASFDPKVAPDRFGDFQLETNLEYRFYIASINGASLNSALFTDIGNVWSLRDDPSMENEEIDLGRLWNDLAIGVGTGLRIDFGFFKLRLDYAYKAKNPSGEVPGQPQWFYNWQLFNGQLQFGVDYPF
jgi:outer membrane protein assembly factor BamA